jgi:hypothetical protein
MQGEDETALEILYNRYAGLIFPRGAGTSGCV